MSSSSSVVDLKRRALALKREGDVDGALQLLRQAKQLEQQEKANQKEEQEEDRPPQRRQDEITKEEEEPAQHEATTLPKEEEDAAEPNEEKDVTAADDDDDLDDLLNEDGPITYTDEEMQDCEMMTEFKLGGMPVPSDDEYQAKILSSKRKALALKNAGDIAGARQELHKAKELEKVRIALSQMAEGLGLRIHEDKDGWLEELSEPDSALVGELLNKNNAAMALDIDDLDDISPDELLDAVEMGMELPTVEDVLSAANEKKALAVQKKQQGDLEGAKAALLECKRLQAAASKLQSILQQMEQLQDDRGGDESMLQALESLLDGNDNNKSKKATGPPKQQQEPKEVASSKTAEELKQEAVRLRNENNMKEATKVFKLYKEALEKEAEAAEKKRCQEVVDSIHKEMLFAKQQRRHFHFYERFVDTQVGAAQLAWWNDYTKRCADAARLIEERGSLKSVTVLRTANSGALHIEEDKLVDFVERGMDASDERLEVGILDVRNIHENNFFKKLLRKNCKETPNLLPPHVLRVEVTVQIPPAEEERDKNVELVFESIPCTEAGSDYSFESSQYIDAPRGDSKFAKTVRRRMERRRIQISVHHVPWEEKRKSWFGGRSRGATPEENVPTLLGKVALELKHLIKRNCVVGDFPLMSSTKAAGGTLGLVVRTGVPFDTDQLETPLTDTTMAPYEAMSFSFQIKK